MNFTLTLPLAVAFIITTIALYTDIKERRVPNWLILVGLIVGIIIQVMMGDILQGLMGLGILFALTIPFWLMGGLGAGDVKLLMVIGLLSNPSFSFSVFFWMAITGGIFSIIAMLLSKNGVHSWRNFKFFLFHLIALKGIPTLTSIDDSTEFKSVTLPYVLPIFAGFVIVVLFGELNFELRLWR